MNTPDKCPKCGAGLDPEFRAPWWICGSHNVGGRFVQAFECKHIARADALAARVKRLEEFADEAMAVIAVACPQKTIDALKAKLRKAKETNP